MSASSPWIPPELTDCSSPRLMSLIEGSYLVEASSPISTNKDVDRSGRHISTGTGSAYDLFLTRDLQHAEIARFDGASRALAALRSGEVDVAAGIRQILEAEALDAPGVRMLDGRFMVIEQAMGTPVQRGAAAHRYLTAFVEEAKASGSVAAALVQHRVTGALVAPAMNQPDTRLHDHTPVGLAPYDEPVGPADPDSASADRVGHR